MKGFVLVLALLPLAASAATITVNATADNITAGNHYCTLREAIANVNAAADTTGGDCPAGTGSGDTITFTNLPAIQLALGELQIQQDVSIIAPKGGQKISGAQQTRVFEIVAGTTHMSGMTIMQGHADEGGGVLVDSGATLHLSNCVLIGNTADSGGGGLSNQGTATLVDCTVTRNRLDTSGYTFGGGIENQGTLSVTNSTLSGNYAPAWGGGLSNFSPWQATLINCVVKSNRAIEYGGGIYNDGGLILTNSTVSGNHVDNIPDAEAVGGGIFNSGDATLTNCTISRNHTTDSAGGIWNAGNAALTNSTISRNYARTFGGIEGGENATLTNCTVTRNHAVESGGGVTDGILTNTIVANNTAGDKTNCCWPGTITSGGHNLDSDGTCFSSGGSDLTKMKPGLVPLRNNGGPTKTMALCTGRGVPAGGCTGPSPAIDAGDDTVTGPPDNLTTDQRGLPRLSGAHVDIGAYEVQ